MANAPHNPSIIARPPRNLHARAVEASASSRHLYIPGQVGIRPDDTVLENLGEQTKQTMENVRAILASAGIALADIVKLNAYCMSPENIITCAGIRNRLPDGARTATTAVVVVGLANPAWKVEADLIAARQG